MRTCDNCKYSKGWHDPDPCMTCRFLADDRNNWEPKKDVSVSVGALIKWLCEYEGLVAKLKGRYLPCQVVAWLKDDLIRALDFAIETMEAKE